MRKEQETTNPFITVVCHTKRDGGSQYGNREEMQGDGNRAIQKNSTCAGELRVESRVGWGSGGRAFMSAPTLSKPKASEFPRSPTHRPRVFRQAPGRSFLAESNRYHRLRAADSAIGLGFWFGRSFASSFPRFALRFIHISFPACVARRSSLTFLDAPRSANLVRAGLDSEFPAVSELGFQVRHRRERKKPYFRFLTLVAFGPAPSPNLITLFFQPIIARACSSYR